MQNLYQDQFNKKLLFFIIILLFLTNQVFSLNYVPNEILIKTKTNLNFQKNSPTLNSFNSNSISPYSTTQTSLNNLMNKYAVTNVQKIDVKTNTNLALNQINNFAQVSSNNIYSIEINKSNVENAIKDFQSDTNIEIAQPDYIYDALSITNDEFYSYQWGLSSTKTDYAWNISKGNSNIIIAIIDTGVDYNHEDLVDNMLGDCRNGGCPSGTGYDFVDLSFMDTLIFDINCNLNPFAKYCLDSNEDYYDVDNIPWDEEGHGTHVAGIAVAKGNNNKGISGVCPNCKIMPLRAGYSVFEKGTIVKDGKFTTKFIFPSIIYAANNGAKIISMSFGGYGDDYKNDFLINGSLDYAHNKGIILVAGAGNDDGKSDFFSPSDLPNVISVTMSDWNKNPGGDSNNYKDISAPGMGTLEDGSYILSTYNMNVNLFLPDKIVSNTPYIYMDGSSMATPFVAGTIGLMLSINSTMTPDQVEKVLKDNVDPYKTIPSSNYGAGIVNVYKSVLAVACQKCTAQGKSCNDDGQCVSTCTPKTCSSYPSQCGTLNDGCGGTINCGCSTGSSCKSGYCCSIGTQALSFLTFNTLASCTCTPDCSSKGKECGGDGCSGSCGTCPAGQTCSNYKCIPDDCGGTTCEQQGKDCGDIVNGCGVIIPCGNCASGKSCVNGHCVVCNSNCGGKNCGDDGCGGSCGNCGSGQRCDSNGKCVNAGNCVDECDIAGKMK